MKCDSEIYDKIGKILFQISPSDAKKVFLTIKVSPQNDVCHFDYDYMDINDHMKWLLHNTDADSSMMDEIISLRKLYIENNLNNGQQTWNTAHMSLDLTTGKFDIEFEFDEVFEHDGEEFDE